MRRNQRQQQPFRRQLQRNRDDIKMANETVNWMLLGVVFRGMKRSVSTARSAIDNNNPRAQPWRSSGPYVQPNHLSFLDHNINSILRKSLLPVGREFPAQVSSSDAGGGYDAGSLVMSGCMLFAGALATQTRSLPRAPSAPIEVPE
jgi:hypothetical protein